MKTQTIRSNKDKTAKILTFTPRFEQKLLNVHPWAARAIISALLKEVRCVLDFESKERLENGLTKIPEISYLQRRSLQWLQNGFRLLDTEIEEGLDILDFASKSIFDANEASITLTKNNATIHQKSQKNQTNSRC